MQGLYFMTYVFKFQPDYDDHVSDSRRLKPFSTSRGKEKSKDNKKYGNYLFGDIVNVIIMYILLHLHRYIFR